MFCEPFCLPPPGRQQGGGQGGEGGAYLSSPSRIRPHTSILTYLPTVSIMSSNASLSWGLLILSTVPSTFLAVQVAALMKRLFLMYAALLSVSTTYDLPPFRMLLMTPSMVHLLVCLSWSQTLWPTSKGLLGFLVWSCAV